MGPMGLMGLIRLMGLMRPRELMGTEGTYGTEGLLAEGQHYSVSFRTFLNHLMYDCSFIGVVVSCRNSRVFFVAI